MRLSAKILVSLVLAVAVALGAATWLINRNVSTTYRTYVDDTNRRQLAQTASQAAALYALQPDWQVVQAWIDQVPRQAMSGMHGRMQGRGPGRIVEQDEARDHGILVHPETALPLAGAGDAATLEQLAAAAPVVMDGRTVALLIPGNLDSPLGAAEVEVLAQVRSAIYFAALIGGAVAVLLGSFLAWSISRPVRALHKGVLALAGGDRLAHVGVRPNDELGDLAQAFNQMARTLQQQEDLRQRMLADIAHELRTPLSVMQGNLQAILDGVYPLAMPEIETVHAETQLLSRLVNDLHELAQAEAGRLPLQLQPVDLNTAVERMASLFLPLAESKQITVTVTTGPRPLVVTADPDRLQQILHNLLGNAIRHTPPGGAVAMTAAPVGESAARLSIGDSGPGIQPEHLPHIFERFYRGDRSRTRAGDPTAGAGLGLAIARALAEAQGGAIGADSPPGSGATFWVQFPTAPLTHS